MFPVDIWQDKKTKSAFLMLCNVRPKACGICPKGGAGKKGSFCYGQALGALGHSLLCATCGVHRLTHMHLINGVLMAYIPAGLTDTQSPRSPIALPGFKS